MSFNQALNVVLVAAAFGYPSAALADTANTNPADQTNHSFEALVDAGLAWPRFWSSEATNEHVGTNVAASLLVNLGRGWSTGISAEWVRIPWTTNTGNRAHFDTVVIGPEGRFTFNCNGRFLPHVYAGFGFGSLSVSEVSLNGKLSGGPAARGGIGLDYRISPRLRLGLSAGMSLMTVGITPSVAQPPYVDPGVPTDPGNVWSLRLGGRGEFL